LRITHQDWGGEIHFDGGQITSATLGSRKGLSALDALVQALPGAAFVFDGDARWTEEPNITLSQDEMQAHLTELVEQSAHGGPTLPSLGVVPVLVPQDDESAAEETMPLDRGTVQTLLAIDGVPVRSATLSRRAARSRRCGRLRIWPSGLVRLPSRADAVSSGQVEITQPGHGGGRKQHPPARPRPPRPATPVTQIQPRACADAPAVPTRPLRLRPLPRHPPHPSPHPLHRSRTDRSPRPTCRGSRRRDDRHLRKR
jgi:hypothetical protein